MKSMILFGIFIINHTALSQEYYTRVNGGKWYLYGTREYYITGFSETKSFNESKAFCKSQNSTLVQPKTEKDQMILKSFKSLVEYEWYNHGEIPSEANSNPHTFYIGLTKINGSYYWSDDELLNYSNWKTTDGEPSNDTNKLCVVYDYNGDKWKTANCSALVHGFICERQHVLNNITWVSNGSYYYHVSNNIRATSYEGVEQFCKAIGGEIPIDTKETRKYFLSVYGRQDNNLDSLIYFNQDSNNSYTKYCLPRACLIYSTSCTTFPNYPCYYDAAYFVMTCQRQYVNPWSSWSKCSSSCLPGIQTRTKNKPCSTNNETQYCDIKETEKQIQPCNTHLCKNTLDQTNCDKSKLIVKECAAEFLHDIFDKAKQQNINSALTYKTYKPKDGSKLALKVRSLKKNNIRVQVVSLS